MPTMSDSDRLESEPRGIAAASTAPQMTFNTRLKSVLG